MIQATQAPIFLSYTMPQPEGTLIETMWFCSTLSTTGPMRVTVQLALSDQGDCVVNPFGLSDFLREKNNILQDSFPFIQESILDSYIFFSADWEIRQRAYKEWAKSNQIQNLPQDCINIKQKEPSDKICSTLHLHSLVSCEYMAKYFLKCSNKRRAFSLARSKSSEILHGRFKGIPQEVRICAC